MDSGLFFILETAGVVPHTVSRSDTFVIGGSAACGQRAADATEQLQGLLEAATAVVTAGVEALGCLEVLRDRPFIPFR